MPYGGSGGDGGIALPVDNARTGWADYNDLASASSPVIVTQAGSPVVLPNDALGPQTIDTYLPVGVSSIWDGVDSFDWSQLPMGAIIDIRLDIELITTSVNTQIEVDLHLGTGAGSYIIPFIPETNFKDTTSHKVDTYHGIYLGDANTRDNGGQFKIVTDKDCSIIVNGWYCKILLRG